MENIEKYKVSVNEYWEEYEKALSNLVKGHLTFRAVMASGETGIGKTYTWRKVLKENGMIPYEEGMAFNGEEYDYVTICGKIGFHGMQELLYEHKDKLIVFDNCDSMWLDKKLACKMGNALSYANAVWKRETDFGIVDWATIIKQ